MTVGEDLNALLGSVVQAPELDITSDLVRRVEPEPPEAVDIRTLPEDKRPKKKVFERNKVTAVWENGKWSVDVEENAERPITMRERNLLFTAVQQALRIAMHRRAIVHKTEQFKDEGRRQAEIQAAIAEAKAAGNYVGP